MFVRKTGLSGLGRQHLNVYALLTRFNVDRLMNARTNIAKTKIAKTIIASAFLVFAGLVSAPYSAEARSVYTGSTKLEQKAQSKTIKLAARDYPRYRSHRYNTYAARKAYIQREKRRKLYRKKYSRKKYSKKKRKYSKKKRLPGLKKGVKGPVQIVVSIPRQRLSVYKNGQLVAQSRVSTGKAGHRTPTGIFSIIQKNRKHFSNLYNNAPMPHMQRITWSGIALHGGPIPNYPASHGCVRLPYGFARRLFNYTKMGAHVIITNNPSAPHSIQHASLFQPDFGDKKLAAHAKPSNPYAQLITGSTLKPIRASYVIENNASGLNNNAAETHAKIKIPAIPLRVLITRRKMRELVLDTQEFLSNLGYNVGPVDGAAGSKTRKAIRAFQKDMDMKVTGTVSQDLVAALYKVAGREAPPNGQLYVRMKFKEVFSAPVRINDSDTPLGTHLFTVSSISKTDQKATWLAQTIKERRTYRRKKYSQKKKGKNVAEQKQVQPAPLVAGQIMSRVQIPAYARKWIEKRLAVGSSVIVTDKGKSHETGKGTDFVVLTR